MQTHLKLSHLLLYGVGIHFTQCSVVRGSHLVVAEAGTSSMHYPSIFTQSDSPFFQSMSSMTIDAIQQTKCSTLIAKSNYYRKRKKASTHPYAPSRAAGATQCLIVTNAAALLLLRGKCFSALAKNDALIRQGQWHRLVTSCFLHSGALHCAVNCYTLNAIGPQVETFFGLERFFLTYFTSAVAGNALSYSVGRSPISVGASGAVFGLLGAWGVFLKRNQRTLETRGMRRVSASLDSLISTCAVNAFLGMSPGSRIDNLAHLGGFLGGCACAYLFGPRLVRRRFGSSLSRLFDEPIWTFPECGTRSSALTRFDRARHSR